MVVSEICLGKNNVWETWNLAHPIPFWESLFMKKNSENMGL